MVGVKVKAAPRRPAPPRDTAPPAAHKPSTLRLFYALKVPADLAPALQGAQGKLRGNWRAVPADQFHVTLAYLPAVPPERVDDLKRLGTRLTQGLAPLHLKLRGTGYFPNEGSPRVWFVKVEGEGLNELAAALREGLNELGVKTDDLPFKAHVTLARKKGPAPRVPPLLFPQGWQAAQVTLFRSILRKTGPIHDTVSTFRLRGAPAPAPDAAPSAPAPRAQETL
ncbi:RNA 2',3'-cyclic phosphodiesterase [Deinococcus arcticus]|uniref:RNA 2',3'-cyclic phosphodiesterase n=1 Tax=Deinococcus arcticus TaxID=2136176 RepID=A0A2T3W4M9_9DEIO|nr:RNA 2',3'-cyclic phosphodiesterase [Deinococcus arcticus]PTA66850.1 RNA 2',3'-cyclic phosphodiesterase [Deinococcus arcticus]